MITILLIILCITQGVYIYDQKQHNKETLSKLQEIIDTLKE